MDNEQPFFTAIVLAADRETNNPVARAAGVRCKSLATVNGTPMIFKVLDALTFSGKVGKKILSGPPKHILDQEPELKGYIDSSNAAWMENKATPSLSVCEATTTVPQDQAILLTTSDHALLTPQIVDYFCCEAQRLGCDMVVALARHEIVMDAYPQTSRTTYRFKDGAYCSCNLFALISPRGRTVPSFWRRIEKHRKNPLRVISFFGWATVFRYLMGKLTLDEAVEHISHRLDCKVGIVIMPIPEAAIDVDSEEDWQLVQRIAAKSL